MNTRVFGHVVMTQENFELLQELLVRMTVYGVLMTIVLFSMFCFASMIFLHLQAHKKALRIANAKILDMQVSLEAKTETIRDLTQLWTEAQEQNK